MVKEREREQDGQESAFHKLVSFTSCFSWPFKLCEINISRQLRSAWPHQSPASSLKQSNFPKSFIRQLLKQVLCTYCWWQWALPQPMNLADLRPQYGRARLSREISESMLVYYIEVLTSARAPCRPFRICQWNKQLTLQDALLALPW